ncbi:LRRN4 C-terminal-like protein [Boleophthalmus pectinirostris]|uniref:LRRN4 C-terminal-like protein n=1 Tax=Boleophthalmus pectinirostris TaxID=150288 RepID=UPI000A1C6F51|nr:LRRN4 C-terminal-like protein [Boleophthalmus pectinirostris]
MAAKRDLPLPLLLFCLLKTISSLPMTSQPPEFGPLDSVTLLGSPTEGFVIVPEEYDDVDDYTVISTVPLVPTHGVLERCDYKPCLENQPSCYELSASFGCLCPGLSTNKVPPEAPNLGLVTLNGSDVTVAWCEPLSYVTGYIVTVGGQEKYTFSKDKRSGSIGQVDDVVQVCVSAVNDAGKSKASCTMYEPSDRSLPLKVGLIGGVLVLLVVLLMVALIWRRRRQRKQEAHISRAQ